EKLETLIAEGRLGEVKGVGEAIAKKIEELVRTGKLAYYEDLRASIPAGVIDMLRIPGLGPRKVKALYEKLGLTTIEQLEHACKEGRVAQLAGFGEKTKTNIIEGIIRRRTYAERHRLDEAWTLSEPILEALRSHPDVIRCGTAGSLRRCKEI